MGCRVTHSSDVAASQARSTIEKVASDRTVFVIVSVTKSYSRGGWGDGTRGELREVTKSLPEYTTFASLPKRLYEVFLKVNKNLMWLDQGRNLRVQVSACPLRNCEAGRFEHEA